VTSEGLRIDYTRLGRGEGIPPSALHPEGHPLRLESHGALASEVEVGGGTRRRQATHQDIQTELARFSEQFMNRGREHAFLEALRIAQSTEGFPANLRITQQEVQLELGRLQGLTGPATETMLRQFKTRISSNAHAPASLDGSPELTLPAQR